MAQMRILVVAANAFSQTANNGKTYRSFIADMPPENVAQFYTGTNESPDTEVCKSYFRITDIELSRAIISGKAPKNSHESLIAGLQQNAKPVGQTGFIRSLKENVKNLAYVRDAIWASGKWDTNELDLWIRNFRPTHIFAVLGGNGNLHKVALKLSKRYNLPLNVFFTDDYVLNDDSTNLLQRLYHHKLLKIYCRTIRHAAKCFVIGTKMKEAYEHFFKREFDVLVNGIHFEKSQTPEPKLIDKHSTVVISYIGGLHLNRAESIIKLGQIFQRIHDYKFDIRVFCMAKPSPSILNRFKLHGIRFCGQLDAEGVKHQIEEAHILLHAESFDSDIRKYTHFSVSSKIPEYMSSMRGIIAYGPHEIASVQIFEQNKFGCVLTDLDSDSQMEDKLRAFLESYNQLDFARQYEFAYSNFNRENMQLSRKL